MAPKTARSLALLVTLVAAACARGAGAPAPAAGTPAAIPAPSADHHAHLASAAARALHVFEPLPEVELPPELDVLFRDYERTIRAGDIDAYVLLFTEDAVLDLGTNWIRGRDAIARELRGAQADLRFRAHDYRVDGGVGYIAGTYGLAGDPAPLERILLALRRGDDGRWRIAVELTEGLTPPATEPRNADELLRELDADGIQRATVLSVAYWFGSPGRQLADEADLVRAENDFVAAEVARHPDRLVGFCSFNPLEEYALDELDRCARDPRLSGLKLHLGNADVDLRDPAQRERVKEIFRAANAHRLAIVVHLRGPRPDYGRADAEAFVREVLPAAPDVPVQVAHLAGWGGFDEATQEASAVFGEAIAAGDPHTRNLFFDLSGDVVVAGRASEVDEKLAARIRQLGVHRILFGRDGVSDPGPDWEVMKKVLPLSPAELSTIATNVAPYLLITPR